MAQIPARLAVRIDRLSRTAHRFHRFAHHPLCDEYGGELVRLGRRNRVCRGCLFVALGGLTGLTASFLWRAPFAILVSLSTVAWGGLAYATIARSSSGGARTPKLVSRFLPALALAFTFGGALHFGAQGFILASVSTVPLLVLMARYRRRGPDRSPCRVCSERNLPTPCRGVAPIIRRERAFRRLAGRWLARVGT